MVVGKCRKTSEDHIDNSWERRKKNKKNNSVKEDAIRRTFATIERRWKRSWTRVLTDLVEVERVFAGYGTVEPSFQVRGPIVVENVLAAGVLFAHPGHAGKYAFAAVDVLDGGLAEEEEHVLADVVGAHEVRFCGRGGKKKRKTIKLVNWQIAVAVRLPIACTAGRQPIVRRSCTRVGRNNVVDTRNESE